MYYSVFGDSEAALRASLDRERSKAVKGGRHDGYTRWFVSWKFSFDSSNHACTVSSFSTVLTTEVVLPQWVKPADPPGALVEKWSRYVAALAEHEEGHLEIARDAEGAVERAIATASASRSCSQLEERVNSSAERAIAEFRDREREYDRITDHGDTQGARFP